MRLLRLCTRSSEEGAEAAPPLDSRWAILKRSRSFSLSSSSVNSLAFRNMPKNSWLFLAGSSPLAIAFFLGSDLNLFLTRERVHFALQEGVLQGDPGLVHEHGQGVQAAQLAARLGIVA